MSATALSGGLRKYAVARWPTANHKFRKARLADLLGFSERRVRSYWEAKAASPRDDEVDAINALIGAQQSEIEEANRHAFEALQERIARLEAIILAQEAQPHHGPMAGRGQGNHRRRRDDVSRPPSGP